MKKSIIALILLCAMLICGCGKDDKTSTSSVTLSQTSELPDIPHKKEVSADIDSNNNENQHITEGDEYLGIVYEGETQKVEDILKGFVDAGIDKITIAFVDKYQGGPNRKTFYTTTTDKDAINELFGILTELKFNYDGNKTEVNPPKDAESAYLYFESQGVTYEAGHGLMALSYAEKYQLYEPYATVANNDEELEALSRRMISFMERMGMKSPAKAMEETLKELEAN